MPTLQETFDASVNGLRQQGRKATKKGTWGETICVYLADNGDKCGAGQLIPTHLYEPEFEGQDCVHGTISKCLISLGHNIPLVYALQRIHDGQNIRDWEEHWRNLAQEKNLIYTEPTDADKERFRVASEASATD